MTDLTAQELLDLRDDLGDLATAFTDPELQRLNTRAAGDQPTLMVLALRQMVMSAAKLTNYTQGQTTEQREAVYRHLEEQLQRWERLAGMSGGTLKAGTIDLGLNTEDEDASQWV